MQEASLALDLVVSVRDHVVEGVQELLRTQV
jgi:flagellar hook-basal body complex protein FliE